MSSLSLLSQNHPLASAAHQRERLRVLGDAADFDRFVARGGHAPLRATSVETLQINVGRKCNQRCHHCHVDAGPDRTEVMSDEVVDACLRLLEDHDEIRCLDITGGAPELHPRFRELVETAVGLGKRVIDRCNLTILTVPKYEDLPGFFAAHNVEVVASLPYHAAGSTDRQRGDGVFDRSIRALKMLNAEGYGTADDKLLTLVTNPVGAFLPAPQAALEADFRRVLRLKHGVDFTALICITNMPISRYLDWLDRSGNTEAYMQKLVGAFNPAAVDGIMCRTLISVGYDGRLYDCDFNQMLDMPLVEDAPRTVQALAATGLSDAVRRRQVRTAAHCFGCTAGQGSSCGGATV